MAKTVNSYQEIGVEIDAHKPCRFTCHPTAWVTVRLMSDERINISMMISVGDTCVGIAENEYASIEDVLEAFQIDDLEEIWEVLA